MSQGFPSVQRRLTAGDEKPQRWMLGEMVGRSSAMERLFLQMRYLAGHLRCALIEGERGAGKTLTAKTLHRLGPARDREFVALSAGRFLSGAAHVAELERASGGTLYLSRVDTLNHEQQGRLLHLLGWMEQQRARRFGQAGANGFSAHPEAGHSMSHGAPRALLLSTERPLRTLVLQGRFRSDLQQQLSAVLLQVPSLRERHADIALLVERFADAFSRQYGKRVRGTSQELLARLQAQPWPGNVAELEMAVSRAVLRAHGEWLSVGDFSAKASAGGDVPTTDSSDKGMGDQRPLPSVAAGLLRPSIVQTAPKARAIEEQNQASGTREKPELVAPAVPLRSLPPEYRVGVGSELSLEDPNLDRAMQRHIHRVLASVGGNKLRAARLLGISRSTLYRMLDAEAVSSKAV